jgi:hypothetical protein
MRTYTTIARYCTWILDTVIKGTLGLCRDVHHHTCLVGGIADCRKGAGWENEHGQMVVVVVKRDYCTISTNSSKIFYFLVAEMAEKKSFDLRQIKKNTLTFLCDM